MNETNGIPAPTEPELLMLDELARNLGPASEHEFDDEADRKLLQRLETKGLVLRGYGMTDAGRAAWMAACREGLLPLPGPVIG